jgi:GR25 family glycosyltransferase involved in LPS biosynthesis
MAVDGKFDRAYISARAVRKYSMPTIAKRYEYVLNSMLDVFNGNNGWYSGGTHMGCLLEKKLDTIYYINLDRRVDRKNHFLLECVREGVPLSLVKRVKGIDGTTANYTDAENAMFTKADFIGGPYVKKIMGNQLSHYYILKEIVEKGKDISIIFQDDAVLKSGFMAAIERVIQALPADAEIVHFGFHKIANLSYFEQWDLSQDLKTHIKYRVNEEICILKDENAVFPCSLAYIVTLQGAKNMVAHFERTGFLRATDFNYIDYLKGKKLYYGTNTVLCTGNPALGSDIF